MLKILIAVSVLGGILYYMNADYNEAMEICQQKFSFDTCFHSLNR